MLEHEITFDRVIRWVLVALGAVAAVLLVNRLSSVLLPFFIAWILAYMIYPFVLFLQNKCHLRPLRRSGLRQPPHRGRREAGDARRETRVRTALPRVLRYGRSEAVA